MHVTQTSVKFDVHISLIEMIIAIDRDRTFPSHGNGEELRHAYKTRVWINTAQLIYFEFSELITSTGVHIGREEKISAF